MALKLKPPTHKADAPGTFVSVHDDAWDDDVYSADLQLLMDKALRAKQDAAEAAHRAKYPLDEDGAAEARAACGLTKEEQDAAAELHPVRRFATGKTRFQLDAPDRDPEGKPCTVRSRYLTKGPASEFTIHRLPVTTYQALEEIESTNARMTGFARAGLRAIRSPDFSWEAGESETRVPLPVIQALHDADPSLPILIGVAVMQLCRPLSEAETFP